METTTMHSPSAFAEFLGSLAYVFAEIQPYLPMYAHLMLSALFPIFTGAHASLSRPSSAAKPAKRKKGDKGLDEEDEDEDEDEDVVKMEGLSPSDAIIFPLLAGSTLAGLYFLIKWMGAQMLNKLLGWYFSGFGVFSVAKLANDGVAVLESFCWPRYYVDGQDLWHVQGSQEKVLQVRLSSATHTDVPRPSPLPGLLGRLPLPSALSKASWTMRELPQRKYLVRAFMHGLPSIKAKLNLRTVFSSLVGLATVVYSNFVAKPWWLTNVQGFAFSYSALQLMSPTTFATGSLILAGLFFYDIYFVFYTPMMVTVAGNLDIPIKLLFPRPAEEGQDSRERRLAMLGLGDIVLPGIMIGLALRFDLYMHYLRKQTRDGKQQAKGESDMVKQPYKSVTGLWGDRFWTSAWPIRSGYAERSYSLDNLSALLPSFPKTYFYASVVGYVLGMSITLGIMQVFQHAQPALLYLVPGVLGSLWLTALVRGESREMWDFSEASEEEQEEEEDKGGGKDAAAKGKSAKDDSPNKVIADGSWSAWFGNSFFGAAKSERNAKKLEDRLAKTVEQDKETHDDDRDHEAKSKRAMTKSKSSSSALSRDRPNEVLFFSIARYVPASTRTRSSAATGEGKGEAQISAAKPNADANVAADVHSGSDSDAVLVGNADYDPDATTARSRWRSSSGGSNIEGRSEKRQRTS